MPTNLALDDALIEEARELGGHKTKKAAVTAALEEYVRRQRLQALLDMMGTVDFDPDWDYKADRMRGLKRIPQRNAEDEIEVAGE